jgi:hypothetical protein
MIEMDDIQAFDLDNEILHVIGAFFDDLSHLEESQSKRYAYSVLYQSERP